MKTYRKKATVQAKLFEKGDEDGFAETHLSSDFDSLLWETPFISTHENKKYQGKFGKHYLCIGSDGEKWLDDKDTFEQIYEEV